MSRRSTRNTRMTPARQRKKQFFAEVNARGGRERWNRFAMWIGRFLRIAFVLALLGGSYYGITRGWNSLFWRNPDYALRDVTVKSDGSSLTRDQVIAASGLQLGHNILSYRLPEMQEALKKLPQVEFAEVRRYLPNRMEIRIKERKPVAWITTKASDDYLSNPKSYLVDKDGAWFRPKQVLHEYETLPVIVGVVTDNLQPKQVIRSAELLGALELIRRTTEIDPQHPDSPRLQPRSLDISKGYCIELKDQNGALLIFGLSNFDEQFARLEAARKAERDLSQQIATVNLMMSRNIPIMWVPPLPPEESDFPPKAVENVKPGTKELKQKQANAELKSEPKKEIKKEPKKEVPKKEPKKANPDHGLYKPFLTRS